MAKVQVTLELTEQELKTIDEIASNLGDRQAGASIRRKMRDVWTEDLDSMQKLREYGQP